MSLSLDPEIYFKEIATFLKEYNFIFKDANTEIFTENILMKMCEKFKIKPTDKLKCDNNQIIDCDNQNLLEMLNKIDYFRTNHSIYMSLGKFDEEILSSRHPGSKSVPLGTKKRHEIIRMSAVIHGLCLENDCKLIVDMGSGLGYLSQHLHTIYGYNVLGIESDTQRLHSATKRQDKYHNSSIGKVKYHSHTITSHSNIYLQELIMKEFPNYHEKICLTGLHACADLTIDAMKLFLDMKNAFGLVIMPCCYHKLSLADSKHSFNKFSEQNPNQKIENIDQTNTELIQNDTREDSKIFRSLNDFTISANHIINSIHPTEKSSKNYTQDHSQNKQLNKSVGKDSEINTTNTNENLRCLDDKIGIYTTETSSQHIQDYMENIQQNMIPRSSSDSEKCQHFNYFPLCNALKVVLEESEACMFLKRPFLRLCCQPPCVEQPMDLLVFRLMSRAVLQLYAVKKNATLVKKKRRAVKREETILCDFDAFLTEAVTNGYTLHGNTTKHKTSNLTDELSQVTEGISDLTGTTKVTEESSLDQKSTYSDERIEFNIDEIKDIWHKTEKYKDLAAIYILLQRFFQPICEKLLLYDRIVYLRENGCMNCSFVKTCDEKISPRCMALVASK